MLGGTQSLHTNSMDETIALPSDKAVKIALRTQQIIAHEIGVTETIDPLGGSYYLESLTNTLEAQAEDYFRQIDAMGGVVAGIERGFFQREIARAAYQYQQEMERKQRIIVGVNEYVEPGEKLEIPHPLHRRGGRGGAEARPRRAAPHPRPEGVQRERSRR